MERTGSQMALDIFFIALSIGAAVYIVETGVIHALLGIFQPLRYVGSFIAGIFFTSVFTTAPAIVILGDLAQENSPFLVALFGGLGAVLGDLLLFRFMRDRVTEDVRYLIRRTKIARFPLIFKTRLTRWFLPLIGAIIIASPLPDEV
ncbi:hypothetical protein L0244_18550, partial [bacterium]|nr:hypothetical protein [bacterium]